MTGLECNPDTEMYETLAGANQTELVQLCRSRGLLVHPGTPRDTLIRLIIDGQIEEGVVGNPVDSWRMGLINFIKEYWQKLRPQLKCPAQHLLDPDPAKRNHAPCFGCTDMQVITCVVQSAEKHPRNEQLIRELIDRRPE